MTKDEALKLALEALELEDMACRYEKDTTPEHIAKAITAIKEALAESEARRKEFSKTTKRNMEHVEWYLSTHAPEPVAWRYLTRYPTQNVWTYCGSEPETKPEREALYTTPPQRKPSQQELDASYATGYSIGFGEGYEAGKATPPQPEQEPVAWRWGVPKLKNGDFEWRYSLNQTRPDAIPLYTTPPQPEQEPVAITITGKLGNIYSFTGDYSLKKGDKVYTTPPQPEPVIDKSAAIRIATSLGWEPKRKPLTIVELQKHWQVAKVLDMTDAEISFPDYVLITKDVEALHGIKERNT